MVKPPCYGCKDRNAECHGICEKYKDYVDKKNAENERIRIETNRTNLLYEDKARQMARMRTAKINWRQKGCVK